MAEFASHSVGTAGLTTGIIGTALGVLNGGLGLLGNSNITNSNHYVSKDELNYVQEINKRDCEIALLKSEQNTEVKIAEVYKLVKGDLNAFEKEQMNWNAAQAVANAQMSSAIATNTNSIAALQNTCSNITKTVVPITSVCPQPMPQYNSWTAPTAG